MKSNILIVDVEVKIPSGPLHLQDFKSHSSEIPESQILKDELSAGPKFDEAHIQQLMEMGFPRNRCEKALFKTNNQGPEVAMNWLFEHMEDPGEKHSGLSILNSNSLLFRY